MSDISPVSILYDAAGNAIKVTQDGVNYKLETLGKIRDSGDNIINPAKEDGNLASIKAKTDNLDTNLSTRASEASLASVKTNTDNLDAALSTRATEATLSSVKDNSDNLDVALSTRATESTLDAVKAKTDNLDVALSTRATEATLTSADTVLKGIRDTAGIKKITDQLPAGTNEIGKVAQGAKASGAGAWTQVLYDSTGNVVGVVQDDTIYRLQADAKIAKKVTADTLEHLKVLDDTGSLKATLYNPDGSAVSFTAAPDDPTGLVDVFFEQSGGTDSSDLRVDGSITPVDFELGADPTDDLVINEVGFVMAANSIVAGSEKFAGLVKLTNGIKFIYDNGTTELVLSTIMQNEEFMHFASPGGYDFWALNKDQIISQQYINGVIVLEAGSSARIVIRINDDLDSGIDYLKCRVKAVKR